MQKKYSCVEINKMKIKDFKIHRILIAVENLHFRCFQSFKSQESKIPDDYQKSFRFLKFPKN